MAPIENLVQRLHAKRRGKGWEATCPCHEDRKPSLSLSEGADRRALVNCFAGCATADILAAIGLTMRDLFPASSSGNGVATTKVWSPPPFDFQKKCCATMNGKDLIRLGNERWFSRAFCSWLHENHYVGIFRGDFAFPVQDNGSVVAAHYRAKAAQVGEKDSWYYFPTGVNTRPLVIGDLAKAKQLHIGESQWDMLALADRAALYLNEHHVFVATRGAGNAALRKDLIPEGVSILVWAQNDEAGQTWLHQVVKCLPAPIGKAVVPSQFKDLNEWTKAGASVEDLYLAMFKNELVEKPLVAEPVQSESTDANADEETLQRLAALPPLEYERVRQAEAEKLGCRRVSILDRLVTAKRLLFESANSDLQGQTLNLPDVEPWPVPVNGAEMLDQVAHTFSQYVALPDGTADVLALWAGHAHAFHAFPCSPRLHVTSPEKRCGKTTLRDVLATQVPRPLLTENLSVAVTFRVIEKYRPTMLADECDSWIKDNDELRGLLNAGHRRGGCALRCDGESNEVRAFNVYAPAVLCGIGALPGTLHDRSIVIRLERAKPGELRARFDSRHVESEAELCRKLARFIADNIVALESSDPKLPNGVFNRLADNWRPLFAIAEIAGGDWPERSAAAFSKLTSHEDLDAQGIGVTLLADIKQVFIADGIFSRDLIEKLAEMKERPWPEVCRGKPITERWLARKLAAFGIHSKNLRIGEEQFKGYELADFAEAFDRYPEAPPGILSVPPSQNLIFHR